MKKVFTIVLTVFFAFVLVGCDIIGKTTETTIATKLTIKNESSYELTHVFWNNVSFANNQIENSIKPGTSVTMYVQAGSGFIRFRPKLNPYNMRSDALVVVAEGKSDEFVFLNNTVVIRESGTVSNGILTSFASITFTAQIGETGPGGGMIFFADGGQFIECSGELGTFNWNDAVIRCQNHNGGGFNDWRLPTRGDLDLMYRNLHQNSLGGFLVSEAYWTSAEVLSNRNYAYIQYFSNLGTQTDRLKSFAFRVRAVRSFSIY